MPVQIRELQIRTVVKEAAAQVSAPASAGKNDNAGQDKIVQACVEQVLEILKEKNER